jgi:hypothetical protein
MAQTRQHLRVALAGKDRADNPQAGCEFRRIPARHTDLMPATVPK